jgi:hypothetical protein
MDTRSPARIVVATALLFFAAGANAQGFSSASGIKPEATAPAPAAVPPATVQPAPVVTTAAPAFSSSSTPAAAVPGPEAPVAVGAPAATAATPPADVTVPFGSAGASPVATVAQPAVEPADLVLVRKAERRLYLMRANRIVAEYPIRLGLNPAGNKEREGDFRTPEGLYELVGRNPRSDFFLSVEVSYPNDEDRARAKKSGVRPGGLIMIHGQPNLPRKPPEYYANSDWTNGCIAVSNSDMVDIWMRTGPGTPIVIRP